MALTSLDKRIKIGFPAKISSDTPVTWKLKKTPQGSQTKLITPSPTSAILIPDKVGEYIVEGGGEEISIEADTLTNVTTPPKEDPLWALQYIRNWIEAIEGGKETAAAIWSTLQSITASLLMDLYKRKLSQSLSTAPQYSITPHLPIRLSDKFRPPEPLLILPPFSGTLTPTSPHTALLDKPLNHPYPAILIDDTPFDIKEIKGKEISLKQPHNLPPNTYQWTCPQIFLHSPLSFSKDDTISIIIEWQRKEQKSLSEVLGTSPEGWTLASPQTPLLKLLDALNVPVKEKALLLGGKAAEAQRRGLYASAVEWRIKKRVRLPKDTISLPYLGNLREGDDYVLEWKEDGSVWLVFLSPPQEELYYARVLIAKNRELLLQHFGAALLERGREVDFDVRRLRGLLFGLQHAPSLQALRVGIASLLGLPCTFHEAEILEIFKEPFPGKNVLIVREGGKKISFIYPSFLGDPLFGKGEKIPPYSVLVRGVRVWDYGGDPKWWEKLKGLRWIARYERWSGKIPNEEELSALHSVHYFAILLRGELLSSISPAIVYKYLQLGFKAAHKVPLAISAALAGEDVEVSEKTSPEIRARILQRSWGDELPPAAGNMRIFAGAGLHLLKGAYAQLIRIDGVRLDLDYSLSGLTPNSVVLDGEITAAVKEVGYNPLENTSYIIADAPFKDYLIADFGGGEKRRVIASSWGYISVAHPAEERGDIAIDWLGRGAWQIEISDGDNSYLGRSQAYFATAWKDIPEGTHFFLLAKRRSSPLIRYPFLISLPTTAAGEYTIALSNDLPLQKFLRAGHLLLILEGSAAGSFLEVRHALNSNGEIADLGSTSILVRGPAITSGYGSKVVAIDPLWARFISFKGSVSNIIDDYTIELSAAASDVDGAYVGHLLWAHGRIPIEIGRYEGSSRRAHLRKPLPLISIGTQVEIWDTQVGDLFLPSSPSSLGEIFLAGARKGSDSAGASLASIDTSGVLTASNPTSMRPNGKDFTTANVSPDDDPFAPGSVQAGDLVFLQGISTTFEVLSVISGGQLQVSPSPSSPISGKKFTIIPQNIIKYNSALWSPVEEWK